MNRKARNYLRQQVRRHLEYQRWLESKATVRAPSAPIHNRDRRDYLIGVITVVMRRWTASPFEHEANCRHGLRRAFCAQGYGWQRSDDEAAAIVAEALCNINARRPTYEQGQPEYALARDYCKWCGRPMPDDSGTGKRDRQYCSDMCGRAAFEHRNFERRHPLDRDYSAAYAAVARLRTKPRPCKHCGKSFHPRSEGNPQEFCSHSCRARWSAAHQPVIHRVCLLCGKPYIAGNPLAIFCGSSCRAAATKIRAGRPPKRLSPYVFDFIMSEAA